MRGTNSSEDNIERQEHSEFCVVERQVNRNNLGQEVERGEGTVIVADVVYVYGWGTTNSSPNSRVPSRVEDGGAQIVHTDKDRP